MTPRKLVIAAALAIAVMAAGCAPRQTARRKFYWVQAVKGHPVHQLTQLAFREGCKKAGYECEVLGTDGPDIAGTVAMAEQALTRGDAAGMAIWTGNPAYNPLIEKAGRAKVPVILPHFPMKREDVPGATGVISCDPAEYAAVIAQRVGAAIGGAGVVAVTQGSFNTTENLVAKALRDTMAAKYPKVTVLPSEEEGLADANQAIAKAVSILQAHPEVRAAVSTTGGGATTWSGAARQTRRKLVVVAMDYTRVNLDLVKSGDVTAIVAQPLWEEAMGAADLLAKANRHETIPWWTRLPAPYVTRADLAPYFTLLDHVEKAIAH